MFYKLCLFYSSVYMNASRIITGVAYPCSKIMITLALLCGDNLTGISVYIRPKLIVKRL